MAHAIQNQIHWEERQALRALRWPPQARFRHQHQKRAINGELVDDMIRRLRGEYPLMTRRQLAALAGCSVALVGKVLEGSK